MSRFFLVLLSLGIVLYAQQPKPISDAEPVPETSGMDAPPKLPEHVEVQKNTAKSTKDVEVVKYPIPNNNEVSFPVTVRKKSTKSDD